MAALMNKACENAKYATYLGATCLRALCVLYSAWTVVVYCLHKVSPELKFTAILPNIPHIGTTGLHDTGKTNKNQTDILHQGFSDFIFKIPSEAKSPEGLKKITKHC